MLTIGVLSEDVGVPGAPPFICNAPCFLLCFATFLVLPGPRPVFSCPGAGLGCCNFLLREQELLIGAGLEATFLFPGGLPGFLACTIVVMSSLLGSSSSSLKTKGPSLSAAGTRSFDAKFIGPNLSTMGSRSCALVASVGGGAGPVVSRAIDALTICTAEVSICPCASACLMRSFLAALSVGSAQLAYWVITSRISPIAALTASGGMLSLHIRRGIPLSDG